MLALRIPDRTLICSEHLLNRVVEPPASLSGGFILPNGVCAMLQNGSTIYSCLFSLADHILPKPKPVQVEPNFNHVVGTTHKLIVPSTRADQPAAAAAKPAKRQSILTIASSAMATDLNKLFAKTMDQRRRDELFAGSRIAKEESDDDEPNNNAQKQLEGAAAVARTMLEAREALEERGERINRVAMKADDILNNAQDYSQNTKAVVNKLKKKNRWGFF